MQELKKRIGEAATVIRAAAPGFTPSAGIILGTGLGALAKEIKPVAKIPYSEIPHFPLSTVETHSGELILGEMSGKKVVAMSGRFHVYEGYDMKQVTFPVRVMKELGIKYLFISNAAGGLNLTYKGGDIAIIEDHINFMGDNPLIGPNDNTLGPRWPDMLEPYSRELIALAEKAANKLGIKAHKGVYLAVTGPCFETRAEYRMMNKFADLVGMSTVPEVIVAAHCGLKVLGISVITDECDPDHLEPTDIKQIIKNASTAEPKMTAIMKEVVAGLTV
ncbi:MAG TPA: purine-nucleoside phosphorylase [Candidatus Goldiibacteriota bacterium]|nr:purine-nucleoside phosphorylase [Candidatus Goldiibacteriota bacterium]